MSDESSDEYFASADEGSVSETDEILQSNATQAVLKTPVPENVTATRQFEATCNTRSAVEECPGPVFSSPVDEPTCDLATYAVASSVKTQSGLPQKIAKEVLVEPKHAECEPCAEPGPPSDLAFGDTESIVDRGLINFVETLQPTPSCLEFHASEDPIGYIKDDKVTPRESNQGDNETEKCEELIKNLSAPVNIVDGSPLSCSLMPIPDGSVPVVTADGFSPKPLEHTTKEFLAADCSPTQLVTLMSKPEELNRSFCQQECMPSPSETPPKVTSESLNQHSYDSDWHGSYGLDLPEPQKSYSTVGDERTRMTSATFLESEEVSAWDEGGWDDSEKVADSRDSSDAPGSHPSVVTDSGLSSVAGALTLSCNMKPLAGGTDQETPTRTLDATLGQQASSTIEIETAVPSCSSSDKYYATEVLSAPCAVDAEEHNRPTHPTDHPGFTLTPNSKCGTECSEPSTQQRKITVADKHDLRTESGSTIDSVHKTSTASQASDEAEGWDLSCVSALSSLPAASKSSLSGQDKIESSCSVAFKQFSNDWDADWIDEEEKEVAKATPDRSITDQKKDGLLEHCEVGTRPEESSDDWDFDEWDCADKTPEVVATKTTPKPAAHSQIAQKNTDSSNVPVLPEYLSTAATSLVKTVGGGLASFVDNFSLANLSATLAAFDGAPPPAHQPLCADPIQDDAKPQDETAPMENLSRSAVDAETKVAVNDEGWGLTGMSWSALAKSLSSTVENKGMQLLQGGVDVLETIGKKTFTALKETDPGLSYTKKFLLTPKSSQTTRLSQVLREASRQHQENLDEGPTRGLEGNAQQRRGDFAYQLEVRHALVHMEALELVSTRASAHLHAKITSLEDRELPGRTATGKDMSISSLTNDGGILDKIWQTLQTAAVSQTEEDESHLEGDCLVENIVANLDLLNSICPAAAIQQKYKQLRERLKNPADTSSATDVFCVAIDSLAEATTAMLTYLHKLAECLLSRPEKVRDGFLDLAQKITIIIQAGKKYNESLCSEYVKLLKQNESETPRQIAGPSVSDEVTPPISSKRHMANLFLETGAANDYLGSASGCFVPIVQLLCVNSFFPNTPS